LISFLRVFSKKGYIQDVLNIYHVHPCPDIKSLGDYGLSTELFVSISATVGGGFFGGLLLGYAIKKVVKLIVVIAGFFIAGLAYLQYQQIAYFDWNKIEALFTTAIGNVTANITNNQEVATLAMSNFGIPLTGGISAGFAVGFMKG
jgi:uncharacterized membrane protein (Fun14 family)